MNINQLEYFVVSVELGSFSSAAKRLYVAPQTVSKAVADLEREWDVQLFERTGRGAKPTTAAFALAARSREVLEELKRLEAFTQSYRAGATGDDEEDTVSLLVAHSPCRGNALGLEDLRGFPTRFPHVRLSAACAPASTCIASLAEGMVDAIVVPGRVAGPGFACTDLAACPLSVALAPSNPLSRRRRIRLEELRGVPIASPDGTMAFRRRLTECFRARGIMPRFVPVPPTTIAHHAFMERQGGVVFVIEDSHLDVTLPSALRLPVATRELAFLPVCFIRAKDRSSTGAVCLERFLLELYAEDGEERTPTWMMSDQTALKDQSTSAALASPAVQAIPAASVNLIPQDAFTRQNGGFGSTMAV